MTLISITVTDTAGAARTLSAAPGGSLMEAIRDAGFDDLLAMCGGACACATCHVHIADAQRLSALPPMSEAEDALLDASDERRSNSRLSCQIPISPTLDGLHLTIAAPG